MQQYNLLDTMSSGTDRRDFLTRWAKANGHGTATTQVNFVKSAFLHKLILDGFATEYEKKMKHSLDNERRGPRIRRPRGARDRTRSRYKKRYY